MAMEMGNSFIATIGFLCLLVKGFFPSINLSLSPERPIETSSGSDDQDLGKTPFLFRFPTVSACVELNATRKARRYLQVNTKNLCFYFLHVSEVIPRFIEPRRYRDRRYIIECDLRLHF